MNISADRASWLFFTGLIIGAVFIAGSAFYALAETLLGKLITIIGTASIGVLSWMVGDVYIAYFFAIALFPWVLVFLEKNYYKALIIYCFFVGLLLYYAHFVRSFAGIPVLCGIGIACSFFFKKKIKIIFPVCALLIGLVVGQLHIKYELEKRNNYLQSHSIVVQNDPIDHTFWHNIYMGFGFISNDKSLEFSDSCSHKKVIKINPQATYLKDEYESILRNEVLRLVFKSPHYALRVIFAKLGVLLYFLLLFANVGLIAAYYYPKPLYIEISYWGMIIISSLPGILTIPITTYLLGFISASSLYGIHSIIYALNKRSRFL